MILEERARRWAELQVRYAKAKDAQDRKEIKELIEIVEQTMRMDLQSALLGMGKETKS